MAIQTSGWVKGLWALCFYICLTALFFLGGGWVYLAFFESVVPGGELDQQKAVLLAAAGALALTLVFGILSARHNKKTFVFGTVLFAILALVTLFAAELTARRFVPAWPASALHGVEPSVGTEAWGRAKDRPGAVGFNSWGQRDRERSVRPDSGVTRVAFVGDSYLEESSTVPLSLVTEQRLNRPEVEVVNLGVSASEPDEYHYRAKHVAAGLGAEHVYLFVYASNDFSAAVRTLPSYWGVAATSPRGSFLSSLGLRAINHLLTNKERPVLRAWFSAGDLNEREIRLAGIFKRATDQQARDFLMSTQSGLPKRQQALLFQKLNSKNIAGFYEVLRNPDGGLFRSYFLWPALQSASVGGARLAPMNEEPTFNWVEKTWKDFQAKGVPVTLVIVPLAFQVDDRMREQWLPLTDMRALTFPAREAARRLAGRASAAGIAVVDLHESLSGVPGAYLNMDGHWSDKGVEHVAGVMKKRLEADLNLKP